MRYSKSLLESTLNGKSAKYLVDSLIEDLPPLPTLYQSICKELPKSAEVSIEDGAVTIKHYSPESLSESVRFLELVYPELDFVLEAKANLPRKELEQEINRVVMDYYSEYHRNPPLQYVLDDLADTLRKDRVSYDVKFARTLAKAALK